MNLIICIKLGLYAADMPLINPNECHHYYWSLHYVLGMAIMTFAILLSLGSAHVTDMTAYTHFASIAVFYFTVGH